MLPSIAFVSSVEMIRDGGSLAASFRGSNGSEYWLFFKVRMRELPSGESERLGYEKPVVLERLTGTEVQISWQHARTLLNQMRPLLTEHAHVQSLEAMLASAGATGQLPPGITRILAKAMRY